MTYELALHALADPTRRAVFEQLRRGSSTVGRLAEGMPVSRPAVSQHLRVLKDAGLVREQKQGTRRMYTVELAGLVELRRYLDGLWSEALSAFAAEAETQARAPERARKGGRRR